MEAGEKVTTKTNGNGIPFNGIPFPFPFADRTNGIPQAM